MWILPITSFPVSAQPQTVPSTSAGSLTISDAHLEESHSSASRPGQELPELWRYHQHQKHGQSAVFAPCSEVQRTRPTEGNEWGPQKNKVPPRVAVGSVSRAAVKKNNFFPVLPISTFLTAEAEELRVCPDLYRVYDCVKEGGHRLSNWASIMCTRWGNLIASLPKLAPHWLTVDGWPLAGDTTTPTQHMRKWWPPNLKISSEPPTTLVTQAHTAQAWER